jgi:prepilin signal peptidase PulO-like enzyme (type II secretory pathway)
LIELLTPTLFLVSYIYWPIAFQEQGIFEFSLWLLFIVGFISLAIYDLRWSILPNRITYNLIKLAIFEFLVILVLFNGRISLMVSTFWGLVLSAGIFYILLFVSRGKWIGGGDVKLGIIIGFLIGGPGNSILMLLIASMLGSLYSIPLLAIGQAKKDSKIPFGPFLIISVIIVKLFGLSIINYYKKLII